MKRTSSETLMMDENDGETVKDLMEQVKELKGMVVAIHELIYQLEDLNNMLEPHTGIVYENEKRLVETLQNLVQKETTKLI
jgi:hypothetical protein